MKSDEEILSGLARAAEGLLLLSESDYPLGEQAWKGEAELSTARRFRHLLGVLKAGLTDLRVYRVGEINIAVYVLGKSPSGDWLGLSTRVVET